MTVEHLAGDAVPADALPGLSPIGDPPAGMITGDNLAIGDAWWVIMVSPVPDNPERLDVWVRNNVPMETVRRQLLGIIDSIERAELRRVRDATAD